MKTKYLTLLIICLLNFSCSKNCILNYEIVETKYEIPFYSSQNEILKQSENTDYKRYELINVYESEIPYIMEILNSQISETRNATNNIVENLCDYSVQIAGIYDRKEKVKKIYLNFECGFIDFKEINESEEYMIGFDGKETKFSHVLDGGDCYFQAEINTKTNKFRIIIVNGEA
ncbi:hypothetical protein [Winogradskyella helgolandensis]|uniref:hypothetical protein n=1 Tax=Winogradskyella helgolandensis TaxID=2697010 RepID=UPI001E4AABF0|nr:hypothetical protein [Winogradskyella helgolandensis]